MEAIMIESLKAVEPYNKCMEGTNRIDQNSRFNGIAHYVGECDRLAELDYHDYSSIIIYLHRKNALELIYSSVRRNTTLKYVTKLLIADNILDTIDHSHGIGERNHCFKVGPRDHSRNDRISKCCHWKNAFEQIKDDAKTHFSSFQGKLVKDPFIENLIVITYVQVGGKPSDLLTFVLDVHGIFKYCTKSSIQERAESIIKEALEFREGFVCVLTTTSTENYLFHINPAIAIVINHETFFNRNLEIDFRIESRKDIEALQRSFRSKKITYYTINDGSLEDVQAIMQNVRTIDFKGLKYMYLVIMSHGDEEDIIHTKTESYSLRDEIVQPLLENPTLANVQKYIIVNACRGKYDPRNRADFELLEKIQKRISDSIIYPQDEKLMMIFSTQKGCISLRHLFVQKFCDSYDMDFYEKSMESICQNTKELMASKVYGGQIPEFHINGDRPHYIKRESVNLFNNVKPLQDLNDFFENQFQINTNCSVLNAASAKSHNKGNVIGFGYVNSSLNAKQKENMERHLKSDYDTKVEDSFQDSVMKFQWSNEEQTGCSTVLATIENND